LIVNKVHDKNFELSVSDIEGMVDVPVMAVIPYDTNILRALSELKPSTSYDPRSKASEEYKKLAATIVGEKYKTLPFKKFLFWVGPKKQDVNRAIYYRRVFN
jgi:septum site-determining protein MinD